MKLEELQATRNEIIEELLHLDECEDRYKELSNNLKVLDALIRLRINKD